jgi:hypothetical protein
MSMSESTHENCLFMCNAYRASIWIARLIVASLLSVATLLPVASSLLSLLIVGTAAIRITAILSVTLRHGGSMLEGKNESGADACGEKRLVVRPAAAEEAVATRDQNAQ